MSGFLLDTNVISEFARPDNKPDPQEKRQPQICADERRHKSAANGREIREFGLYQGTTLVVLQARNRFPSLLSGMDLWPTKGDENRRLPMSCFQSVTLCFRPCRRLRCVFDRAAGPECIPQGGGSDMTKAILSLLLSLPGLLEDPHSSRYRQRHLLRALHCVTRTPTAVR